MIFSGFAALAKSHDVVVVDTLEAMWINYKMTS
jgi:hypothetical protein